MRMSEKYGICQTQTTAFAGFHSIQLMKRFEQQQQQRIPLVVMIVSYIEGVHVAEELQDHF